MACLLTSGYSLGCFDNQGGVKRIFIAAFDKDTTYTLDADGQITAFDPGLSGGPVPAYYTFEQDIEVGSFVQTTNVAPAVGSVSYDQVVELTLIKMTKENRNKLKTLAQGGWRIIIQDNNGQYYLIGKTNPVRVTAGTSGTGKAMLDLNGATITLTGKENEPAPLITEAAALTVIIP